MTFNVLLKCHDAILIPVSKNEFTMGKTNLRLVRSIRSGIPVIADSIESYLEFKEYCFLDDWENGIENVLRSKAVKSGIKLKPNIPLALLEKYNIESISVKWRSLFRKIA